MSLLQRWKNCCMFSCHEQPILISMDTSYADSHLLRPRVNQTCLPGSAYHNSPDITTVETFDEGSRFHARSCTSHDCKSCPACTEQLQKWQRLQGAHTL